MIINSFRQWWEEFSQAHSPWTVEILATTGVTTTTIWALSFAYLSLDIFFPTFSKVHKLQLDKPLTRAQITRCIVYAAKMSILDFVLQFLIGYLSSWRPLLSCSPQFPYLYETCEFLILALIGREILMYYTHRVFHHPLLYARFHKIHHEHTAPIAFSVMYGHPFERIFGDVVSLSAPVFLIHHLWQPIHVLSSTVYLFVVVIMGTAEHSGYDFAQPPVSRNHYLHHELWGINFSGLRFMDWLHGTDVVGWDRKDRRKTLSRLEKTQ